MKFWLLVAAFVVAHTKEKIFAPKEASQPTKLGIIFIGRSDVDISLYDPLINFLQVRFNQSKVSAWVVLRTDLNGIEDTFARLAGTVSAWVGVGHSMTGGSVLLQDYAKQNIGKLKAIVFVAGFLQRHHRPDVAQCLTKASIKPQHSLKFPLGHLKEGVHDCYGPNTVSYPVPTLTIGGELDGVVRITRIAEAYYTQVVLSRLESTHSVAVIIGMNHAILLSGSPPSAVAAADFKSEISTVAAFSGICNAITAFLSLHLALPTAVPPSTQLAAAADFFAPIIDAFVNQEGNWFFTGTDDEHGSSAWAAQAQQMMVEPVPKPHSWKASTNQFRLLSDEEKIPPYYRTKHRASINLTGDGSVLVSDSIAQLRFIELSLLKVGGGLNAGQLIREEKLGIMVEVKDDGVAPVASIEIATKLQSRQKLFNESGISSPDTLDSGSRCQSINAAAYQLGLKMVGGSTALSRYQKVGTQMVMMPDKEPTVSVGPGWIWTYLDTTLDKSNPPNLAVTSYYAFFSVSANPYGAGNHYCKLLSPARVVEWIYVDSLRQRYRL